MHYGGSECSGAPAAAAWASSNLATSAALPPLTSSFISSNAAFSSFTVIWAGAAWAGPSGAQWLLNCLVDVLACHPKQTNGNVFQDGECTVGDLNGLFDVLACHATQMQNHSMLEICCGGFGLLS